MCAIGPARTPKRRSVVQFPGVRLDKGLAFLLIVMASPGCRPYKGLRPQWTSKFGHIINGVSTYDLLSGVKRINRSDVGSKIWLYFLLIYFS